MVFEKLGLSLYDFLKKNSYRPFHLDLVSTDTIVTECTSLSAFAGLSFSLGLQRDSRYHSSCLKVMSLAQVRSFGRQLLESISYLHDLNLIHTDLKPENILLQSLEYDKLDTSSRYTIPI